MTQPIVSIQMTKPGVELVLSALAALPYAQSAGLIQEIEAQANYQLQELQLAAEAADNAELVLIETPEEETAQ